MSCCDSVSSHHRFVISREYEENFIPFPVMLNAVIDGVLPNKVILSLRILAESHIVSAVKWVIKDTFREADLEESMLPG